MDSKPVEDSLVTIIIKIIKLLGITEEIKNKVRNYIAKRNEEKCGESQMKTVGKKLKNPVESRWHNR